MKLVISRVLWIVSLLWIEVTVDAGPHDQGTECTSMPTEEGETVKVDISLSPEINLNNDTVYIYLRRNHEPDTLRCDRKTSGSALQCDILNGSPFQTEGLTGHKLTMYAPNATVNLDGVYVLGVSVNGALNKPINCNVTVVKRKEGQHLAASDEDNYKGFPISIVIGLIVAVIVLDVVIVALIVLRRRSRRKKQGNRSKSGGADNVDREEEESKLTEEAAPAGEMNSKEKDEQPEQIDIIVEEEAKQPEESELLNPGHREEDSQTEGKKQKTQDDKSFQFPSVYISSKDPSAAGHQAEQSGGQAASAGVHSNRPEERGCLSTETETSPKDAPQRAIPSKMIRSLQYQTSKPSVVQMRKKQKLTRRDPGAMSCLQGFQDLTSPRAIAQWSCWQFVEDPGMKSQRLWSRKERRKRHNNLFTKKASFTSRNVLRALAILQLYSYS